MIGKVCIITGSRAEYGLLRLLMQGIDKNPTLTLQIIVTGSHLSKEFGFTYKEIENDGFRIDYKVESLQNSDSPSGVAEAMGLGISGCGRAIEELKPDLIVLLGDRYEIMVAAAAALVAKIPVAHIHGGEVTTGAFDDALRHSITKMSNLHFVATEKSRKRVIQLGEDPNSVFLVGGLGVDAINDIDLLDRDKLEKELNLKFLSKNLLITFHPETLSAQSPEKQLEELLSAINILEDTALIFTMPNSDTGGKIIAGMIEKYVAGQRNSYYYKSLGQKKYLSVLAQVDGVLGNSSSGLLEVPTFKKGTINIGDRQLGRETSPSVINCKPTKESIRLALEMLYSKEFSEIVSNCVNPYGEGGASLRILKIIQELSLVGITKKTFHDL
jgi:GDP/UDP-N,N'-diacetylbacillosamine 2-epimerase (hydrolysing)